MTKCQIAIIGPGRQRPGPGFLQDTMLPGTKFSYPPENNYGRRVPLRLQGLPSHCTSGPLVASHEVLREGSRIDLAQVLIQFQCKMMCTSIAPVAAPPAVLSLAAATMTPPRVLSVSNSRPVTRRFCPTSAGLSVLRSARPKTRFPSGGSFCRVCPSRPHPPSPRRPSACRFES
jgi:hypothetical protein